MRGLKGSVTFKPFPKELVWNLNWVTHALVNKTPREEFAKHTPMPKSLQEEMEQAA